MGITLWLFIFIPRSNVQRVGNYVKSLALIKFHP